MLTSYSGIPIKNVASRVCQRCPCCVLLLIYTFTQSRPLSCYPCVGIWQNECIQCWNRRDFQKNWATSWCWSFDAFMITKNVFFVIMSTFYLQARVFWNGIWPPALINVRLNRAYLLYARVLDLMWGSTQDHDAPVQGGDVWGCRIVKAGKGRITCSLGLIKWASRWGDSRKETWQGWLDIQLPA